MTNNYLSVLNKHIIQVENKNVGLKVCGGGGGAHARLAHPPPTPVIMSYVFRNIIIILRFNITPRFLIYATRDS